MVYVRLFNCMGILVDEIEVKDGLSVMDALFNASWDLQIGDTIRIVDAEEE